MSDLNKLYTAVIKKHNESPFHFEPRSEAAVKAYNPVCGDRFEFFLPSQGSNLGDVYFHGFGCAISKGSASVLAMTLSGKTKQEALALCTQFLNFIEGKSGADQLPLGEEFRAFAGVHEYPERYDCAAQSWKEMKKYLETLS